ncbi:unnamed protein product [Ectocarpus sp. CCAP 1310/34]|nr:unnamed protein product [Ectocarpus sp. CCAP 1310/34]
MRLFCGKCLVFCCPLCVTHLFVAFAVSALLAGLAPGIFPCLVSSIAGTVPKGPGMFLTTCSSAVGPQSAAMNREDVMDTV